MTSCIVGLLKSINLIVDGGPVSKRFLQTIWAMMVVCGSVGCTSTTGSFAYQVVEASERSKYTRDTSVTKSQMAELEAFASNLEGRAPSIKFNDASGLYAAGQVTDGATVAAVAGSAAGFFSDMSDLSMGMFGAMALFDSSHIDKAAIGYSDMLALSKERNSSWSILNDLEKDIDTFASDNQWTPVIHWEGRVKGKYAEKQISTGYTNTGMCDEKEVLVFSSAIFYEDENDLRFIRKEEVDSSLLKEDGGNIEIITPGFSLICTSIENPPGTKNFYKNTHPVEGAKLAVFLLKLSKYTAFKNNAYLYAPPSSEGLPIPALMRDGEIFWMASVK